MTSAPTLVLMGAGATRAATFAEPSWQLHKPPLDLDFFKLLALSPAGRSGQAKALLDYVRLNHSPTLDASMEAVFVELEGTAEFYEQFKIGQGRIVRRPQRTIEHFYGVVPAMLRYAIHGGCEYHNLLAKALEAKDAVISLNYDCVMDTALSDCGGRRWNPAVGYGLRVEAGAADWRQWGRGANAGTPIRLLKLHGSLNWSRLGNSASVRLKRDPYDRATAKGAIVPPLGRKPVAEEPFRSVWAEARLRTRAAERLIVIGYSLPAADYLVRALLRADLRPDLRHLVVVDPSDNVVPRFLQLLRQTPQNVIHFRTFRDFTEWFD